MLHMEETEKLLYRLTEWEQEQAAGRMTQEEFRSAIEALPRDLRPLDWYGIEAPVPGRREETSLPEFDEKSFILSGDDVCVRKHDTRDATPAHSHNFYELIAVLDGTARNTMENREVELGRGQMFLLCPKEVHGISCSPRRRCAECADPGFLFPRVVSGCLWSGRRAGGIVFPAWRTGPLYAV